MYGHASSMILAGDGGPGIGDALRDLAQGNFRKLSYLRGKSGDSQGFPLRNRLCSAILHRRHTRTRRERDAMRSIENTAVNDLIARASGGRRPSASMTAVDDDGDGDPDP